MEFIPFNECVRARRKELGMSREELAAKLHISKESLGQVELGRVKTSQDQHFFTKMARALQWKDLEKDHMQKLYEIGKFGSRRSKFHLLFDTQNKLVVEFLYRLEEARPERRAKAIQDAIKSLRGLL